MIKKNQLIGPEASNCQTMAEEDGNPPEVAACQHWVGCPPASLGTPASSSADIHDASRGYVHGLASISIADSATKDWEPLKTRRVQVKENKDHQILDTLDAEVGHRMVQSYHEWSWPQDPRLSMNSWIYSLRVLLCQRSCIFSRSRGAVTEKGLWPHGGSMRVLRAHGGPKGALSSASSTSGIDMSTCGFSTCLIAPCLKFDFSQQCAVRCLYPTLQCFEDKLGMTWWDFSKQETVLWLWWFLWHSHMLGWSSEFLKYVKSIGHGSMLSLRGAVLMQLRAPATWTWGSHHHPIQFVQFSSLFFPTGQRQRWNLPRLFMSGCTYTYLHDCLYIGKAMDKCTWTTAVLSFWVYSTLDSEHWGTWWTEWTSTLWTLQKLKRLERIKTTLANTKVVCRPWLAKPLPTQIARNR